MASRSLGTLTLDLVAKIGGFTAGMDKAERKVDSFARNTQRKMSGIGKAIGASLGLSIAGALTGVVASISNAIDRMDSLRDASIRLGVGVETLSAYSFAAEQLGTDIDALGKGFKILAKNIADAGEGKGKAPVFEALGISIKDAEGNLRSLEDVIPDIANAFQQLEDGTQKAALAQELFGKSGLDLIEFLNQGGAGLKEFTDKARELGLVIDQDAADAADNFNDTLAELKASFTGVALSVAQDLLPDLLNLAQWAKDWVQDGGNAKEAALQIASAMRDLAAAIGTIGDVLGGLDSFKDKLSEIQQFLIDWSPGTSIRKKIQEAIWGQSGDWDLNGFTKPDFSSVRGGASGAGIVDFSQVAGSVRMPSTINNAALNRALGGATTGSKKKASGGKSDAEREAEALAKAINKMTDAQREWQTELDGTGNQIADEYARRLASITEQAEDFKAAGIPTEKIAEFRAEMEKLAGAIRDKETVEFLKEFNLQTQEMAAGAAGVSTATIEYARAMEELNKQLASGIINQEAFAERAEALAQVRDSAANSVLASIREEQDLLGTSAEYQDTYNKLRYAGVDANSEFGKSIIAANDALWKQKEAVGDQIEAMDALRDAGRGIFDDLYAGVGIWDALKNAADDFAATLFRMVANNLVEKALGQQGTSGGGAGGGWFSNLLGAFFGAKGGSTSSSSAGSFLSAFSSGGYAIGGVGQPGGLYRVNENGPEIASFGGQDYLMVGRQAVTVSPMTNGGRRGARGGDTYVMNFPPAEDRRAATAVRAKMQFQNQYAQSRNG
jgi:TP901 family phage tail tape measure protein